jgi:hypothetical protein
MGYRPVKKLYRMTFVDYPGLEITAKGTSIGKLLDMAKAKLTMNDAGEETRMEIFTFFASRIIKWNLEHPEIDFVNDDGTSTETCPTCGLAEGDELPATVGGLQCLELQFVMTIMFGWMETVSKASAPKGQSSSSGETTPDMQMQRLSELQSPLTSQMQN